MKRIMIALALLGVSLGTSAAPTVGYQAATNIARAVAAEATNAIRRVEGAARPLPKYLHHLRFDDTYPEDAAWYYGQADSAVAGGCSARRREGILERNYDWSYDESASFVLSVGSSQDRFASIGVASAGTNLTEEVVTSGRWSRYYKVLPGRTLDGINENGVVCEINVVATNGSPWETRTEGRDLNAIGAVRWALDHATSAEMAAQELAKRVYIPESMKRLGYSAHFMVADASNTFIVEDGKVYHDITEVIYPILAVLTNVRIRTFLGEVPDPYGTGLERMFYLFSNWRTSSITNAWYSEAYRRGADGWFPRPTEFAAPGVGTNQETEKLQAWAEANVPAGAPESLKRNGGSWQTVHTSVYDFEARTLKVAVQETDDWYVFALGKAVTDEARVREIADEAAAHVVAPATNETLRLACKYADEHGGLGTNEVRDIAHEAVREGAYERVKGVAIVTNLYGGAVNGVIVGANPFDGELGGSVSFLDEIEGMYDVVLLMRKTDEGEREWVLYQGEDDRLIVGDLGAVTRYWFERGREGAVATDETVTNIVKALAPSAGGLGTNEVRDIAREIVAPVEEEVGGKLDKSGGRMSGNLYFDHGVGPVAYVEDNWRGGFTVESTKAGRVTWVGRYISGEDYGWSIEIPERDGTFALRSDIPAPIGNYAAVSNAAMGAVQPEYVATTPIPAWKADVVSYINPRKGVNEDQDGSVVIGKGASGTVPLGEIEGRTVKTILRSEAVAIGHNAAVEPVPSIDQVIVQGVAIGWNARASGNGGVAIGAGAQHWDETPMEGGGAYASGNMSFALGYGAKATATGAAQIGLGENAEAGTLKFKDWKVVGSDGKIPLERLPVEELKKALGL